MKSANYAFSGLLLAIREERNMAIHSVAAISALVLGILLGLTAGELSLIIICCALVLCSELANSACERLLDSIKPRISPHNAAIKDMLSACVLIASLAALCTGILIFLPHIFFILKLGIAEIQANLIH